jgi:hypothetical protein
MTASNISSLSVQLKFSDQGFVKDSKAHLLHECIIASIARLCEQVTD